MTALYDDHGHSEYHRFVGAFINEYAQLELVLRELIRLLSGLDSKRYETIVGFPRSGEARALARKLVDLAALEPEVRPMINDAFDWLNQITQLRDRIVHYGGTPVGIEGKEEKMVILFAKASISDTDRNSTTQDNLWAAVTDARRIKLMLTFHLGPKVFRDQLPNGWVPPGPWQYKPLQQP